MTAAYFEDHPTDPDKVILRKKARVEDDDDIQVYQRPWVNLTDEEIDEAIKSCRTLDTYKYFRAVEAKLKEKNT